MVNKSGPKKASKSFGTKANSSSTFYIVCIAWILVVGWLILIVVYWRSGLLNSASLDYVNNALLEAESKIEKGISHIHMAVPIEHLPGGPELNKPLHSNKIDGKNAIAIPIKTPKPVDSEKYDIHVIFSTDCNAFQDWQTLVVFQSAVNVGQRGPVTRIASGCDSYEAEDKKAMLIELYKQLYPGYGAHFTPDFKKDEKTKARYDFYNKPRGLKHWLDNANPAIPDGVVIALIDPDFVFVRPMTTQIKGMDNNIVNKAVLKELDLVDKVAKGKPVAQMYGLGAPWTNDNHAKFNRGHVCGEGSPCLGTTMRFGELHYAVGPPYLLEKTDMHRLAYTWVDFVPRVYEKYPYLLAEMYAYSMAAAHENLPHLQMEQFMVSNDGAGGEGWPWVDVLDDACVPPVDGIFYPGKPMPTFVHYCQSYRANELGFSKRALPLDIFSCESPMLVDPPRNLSQNTKYRYKNHKEQQMNPQKAKRNVFPFCVIHTTINSALMHYKTTMCAGNPKTNYNRTLNVLGP